MEIIGFAGGFGVGELRNPIFISADVCQTSCIGNRVEVKGRDFLILLDFELAIEEQRLLCHETLGGGGQFTLKSVPGPGVFPPRFLGHFCTSSVVHLCFLITLVQ